MADLTRQDEIAAALSADIESVRNEKKILDLIMKQVEVAEKQLKAAQSHHLGADAMAKNAKTLDTLMYSIRNVKDFHRLDRATRRSLYDKANTSIAMTMTMVLGAKYRALLDDIDGEDGMAIWELLAADNEDNCEDPIGRKLDEIRALTQDDDGHEPRKSAFHFSKVAVHCVALIHMMNRDRRSRIDSGGLDPHSEEAELKMPHEHRPTLKGLLAMKGGSSIRCTMKAAYHIESIAYPRLYQGLAKRYREVRHNIATLISKGKATGEITTVATIKLEVKEWERIHSGELIDAIHELPRRRQHKQQRQQRRLKNRSRMDPKSGSNFESTRSANNSPLKRLQLCKRALLMHPIMTTYAHYGTSYATICPNYAQLCPNYASNYASLCLEMYRLSMGMRRLLRHQYHGTSP